MHRLWLAAFLFLGLPLAAPAAILNVTSTANDGPGSLRQAILAANAIPEADRIEFGIRVLGRTVPEIQLTSPLPAITRSLDIDGTTQAAGLIELNGSGAGAGADGLRIQASGCEIRGLVINRFSGDGIEIVEPARDAWIRECLIGTSDNGVADLGNGGHGVLINNSAGNAIGVNRGRGGPLPTGPYRNVISGNGGSGVFITGSGATGNDVAGNYIGINAAGAAALGNGGNGMTIAGGALGNLVGAIIAGSHNVISGNAGHGIEISSVGAEKVLTLASADVPKTVPVWTDTVGEVRSTLSVNEWFSVLDLDVQVHLTHNPIDREALSLIGPDGYTYEFQRAFDGASGDKYLNTTWDDEGGFMLFAAPPYSGRYFGIGRQFSRYDFRSPKGTWQLQVRNVDRTNAATLHSWSLLIATIPGNVVAGNFIGVDATGGLALGNGRNGVHLSGSPGNRVGGTTALERNVIAGNANDGIHVTGANAVGNVISGNYIGLAADGQTVQRNTFSGVAVFGGARNMIGGAPPGAGNVVSGNGFTGLILSAGAQTNEILGNLIGVAADGTTPRGNGADGIRIEGGSGGNRVGGIQANASFILIPYGPNVIAHNQGAGVLVTSFGGTSSRNAIRANSIYANGGLGIDLSRNLPADGVTRTRGDLLRGGPNNLQNAPELEPYFAGLNVEGYVRDDSDGQTEYLGVDYYTSPASDVSGYGEGKVFLGSLPVSYPENGVFDLTQNAYDPYRLFTPTAGEYITATATDQDGNTSEFSKAETILPHAGIGIGWRSSASSDYGGALQLDQPFTYTTSLLNNGPNMASSVWLTNDLPDSVELVSYAITTGTCTNIGGVVICNIGNLEVGTNARVNLTMVVVPKEVGFITNRATVSSPSLPSGTRSTSPLQFNWVGRPMPVESSLVGTNLVITGSTNQLPGGLQWATNLTVPVVWHNLGIPYQRVSSNWHYQVPLTNTNRFFRTVIRTKFPPN